jgi:ribonuclease BN (tRNA processing enzyme)
MRVTLGGVRGSFPTAGGSFAHVGHATLSVLVEQSNSCIIIDAGTGMRRLVRRMVQEPPRSLHVFLTHYHLDHLVGLASLYSLVAANWAVSIHAPRLQEQRTDDPSELIRPFLKPPYWPVDGEGPSVVPLEEAGLLCGSLRVATARVHHPGGGIAYRVDSVDGQDVKASMALVTDFEWSRSSEHERAAILALCTKGGRLDLLLCEGQYSPCEYQGKKGWGHSTFLEAAEIGEKCDALDTVVIHHDPARRDRVIKKIEDAIRERFRARAKSDKRFHVGHEGDVWSLPAGKERGPERLDPEVPGKHDFGSLNHLKWLAEVYHHQTVLADAKAGFVIALNGALAGATFQGLGSMFGAKANLHAVLSLFAFLPFGGYVLVSVLSIAYAFAVLLPRTSNQAGEYGVLYYRAVARMRRDPRGWQERLTSAPKNRLLHEFSQDAVSMARIVDRKVWLAARSIKLMGVAGLAWALWAGCGVVQTWKLSDANSRSPDVQRTSCIRVEDERDPAEARTHYVPQDRCAHAPLRQTDPEPDSLAQRAARGRP